MKHRPLPDARQALTLLDEIAAGAPASPAPLPDGPLVLYGAGKLGAMSAQILSDLDHPIAYAIDRNPPADGMLLGRIPVRHPDAVAPAERAVRPLAVCVVTSPYTPIRDQLHASGWRHVAPVYDVLDACRERCGLNNGWFAGPLDPHDRDRIATVLAAWHDDASRAAHLQTLAWRVLREEWAFADAPIQVDNRYFIPEVLAALHDHEDILDGGAWHGEALEALIGQLGGRFAAALAVEPDPANAAQLRRWRNARPSGQRACIAIGEYALGEVDGVHPFGSGMGLASRLRGNGNQSVRVCTIDALGLSPSLIKLHLEGHELPALRGARATLARCRPLLEVTTYHDRDGLWKIPAWLLDTLPDYRLLMRGHGWCGTGTVVYCIPAERWPA